MPYSAELSSGGLGVGRHQVEARAFDGAGQQATANAPVEVLDASVGTANGNPTVRSALVRGGFGSKARARRTVGYGKAALLRGRLVTPEGRPIGGATLQVASRILAGNRGFREIAGARVVTGADGGFVYRVPPGASRQVRIAYRAYSRDTAFAAQRLFSLRTRAGDPVDREADAGAQRRARDLPRPPARRPEAARRCDRRPPGARAGRPLPHVPDGPHQAQGRALLGPLPLQPHDAHDRVPLPRARPQADRLRLQHRLLAGAARDRDAVAPANAR